VQAEREEILDYHLVEPVVEDGLKLFEITLGIFLKVAVAKERVDTRFETYGSFR
jgi:hypothetical protein